MTHTDLKRLLFQRVDEDSASPVHYTSTDATSALNAAQRWFVLLTLCLEKVGTYPLTAAQTWYRPRTDFSATDWLVPLRVNVVGGARVRASRLADLDAKDVTWEAATPGAPERYSNLGINLFAVTPQPAAGGTSIKVTFAHAPVALVAGGDTPGIPKEYHPSLVDFAIPRLRLREGGQEFIRSLFYLERFFEDAMKCATFVRQRSLAQRYDTLPFELKRADLSRMLRVRPLVEPRRGITWLQSGTQQEAALSSSQT